jgi:O-antigen ligase
VIQLFVLAALYDRWGTVVRGAAIVTVVLAAALVAVPGFATLVLETLTWQSASSISHLEIWGMGLAQLLEHPLGLGLGAGSLVAARFGLPVIAGDNQYLTYSTTLGLPGLLLYAAVLVTLLAAGLRAFRTAATASARDYGALVAVAALGIAINGITTDLISNAFLSYTFFWLAGTAVSAIRDRV